MPKRTYVWRDGKIVELVREEPKARMQIIEDIKPYRNMYDFTMINSRREHREFLKRGDGKQSFVEVGSDTSRIRESNRRKESQIQAQPDPHVRFSWIDPER